MGDRIEGLLAEAGSQIECGLSHASCWAWHALNESKGKETELMAVLSNGEHAKYRQSAGCLSRHKQLALFYLATPLYILLKSNVKKSNPHMDQNEKKRRPKWVTASRGQSPCVCKHWNWWNLLPHSPSSLSTKQFPCPCPAVLPVPLCQCTGELLQSRMCAGCAALCLAQQGAAHLSSSGGCFLQNLIILGTPAHWNGNLASWGIKSEGRRRAPSGSMTAANPISLETQAGKGGSVRRMKQTQRNTACCHWIGFLF